MKFFQKIVFFIVFLTSMTSFCMQLTVDFGIAPIDDIFSVANQKCLLSRGNHGVFCLSNGSPTTSIVLNNIVWGGCQDNNPNLTLTPENGVYQVSWGATPFVKNCTLESVSFQVLDSNGYSYTFNVDDGLVPSGGSIVCSVVPDLQCDKTKMIRCGSYGDDGSTVIASLPITPQ